MTDTTKVYKGLHFHRFGREGSGVTLNGWVVETHGDGCEWPDDY